MKILESGLGRNKEFMKVQNRTVVPQYIILIGGIGSLMVLTEIYKTFLDKMIFGIGARENNDALSIQAYGESLGLWSR